MLSIPLDVGYIHEPFNRDYGLEGVDEWFPYVRADSANAVRYQALVTGLLNGTTRFSRSESGNESLRATASRFLVGSRTQAAYRALACNPILSALIIKDPLACLSAEWLHRAWGMEVLVLVRHPAAFIASLLRMGWRFDLGLLATRKDLMNDHLGTILDENKSYNDLSAIEEGAILWKCLYSVMTTYADRNTSIIVKTHEEISRDPITQFSMLYDRFGLHFSRRVARIIGEETGEANPTAPKERELHTMKRDSRSNIKRWKQVLDADQIDYIRSRTEDLASRYYSSSDW